MQGITTPQYEEIPMPLMDISKDMPYIHADVKFSLTNPIYKANLKPNTTYTVIANYQYTGTNEIPNTLHFNYYNYTCNYCCDFNVKNYFKTNYIH
mgnify:CR=1 FL=1